MLSAWLALGLTAAIDVSVQVESGTPCLEVRRLETLVKAQGLNVRDGAKVIIRARGESATSVRLEGTRGLEQLTRKVPVKQGQCPAVERVVVSLIVSWAQPRTWAVPRAERMRSDAAPPGCAPNEPGMNGDRPSCETRDAGPEERPNEPSRAADRPNDPSRAADGPNEASRVANKSNETSRAATRLNESSRAADRPNETSRAAERPNESSRAADSPNEPSRAADKSNETSRAADRPNESSRAADSPNEPSRAADRPNETSRAADRPNESSRAADSPNEPSRAADRPNDPSRAADGPNEPSRAADGPNESSRAADKTNEPSRAADKTNEPSRAADTTNEPSRAADRPNESLSPTTALNASPPEPAAPLAAQVDAGTPSLDEAPHQASLWTADLSVLGGGAIGPTPEVTPGGTVRIGASYGRFGAVLDAALEAERTKAIESGTAYVTRQWLGLSGRVHFLPLERLLLDLTLGVRGFRLELGGRGYPDADSAERFDFGGALTAGARFRLLGPLWLEGRAVAGLRTSNPALELKDPVTDERIRLLVVAPWDLGLYLGLSGRL